MLWVKSALVLFFQKTNSLVLLTLYAATWSATELAGDNIRPCFFTVCAPIVCKWTCATCEQDRRTETLAI